MLCVILENVDFMSSFFISPYKICGNHEKKTRQRTVRLLTVTDAECILIAMQILFSMSFTRIFCQGGQVQQARAMWPALVEVQVRRARKLLPGLQVNIDFANVILLKRLFTLY